MNFRLKWVYFIRRFQKERGNGEFEFRSLNKFQFGKPEYQELLNEVMNKQTVTYSEWSALNDQRIKEINAEMEKRDFEEFSEYMSDGIKEFNKTGELPFGLQPTRKGWRSNLTIKPKNSRK